MSSPISSVLTPTSSGFDPEMLKALSIQGSENHDTEMLGTKQNFYSHLSNNLSDMETQVQPAVTQVLESIESFGQETAAEAIEPADVLKGRVEMSDNGLGCFCEVFVRPSILASGLFSAYFIQQMEDQLLFCDGPCKKWFHVWYA